MHFLSPIQRWGRRVCGNRSTEWNLCVGTQHGIHRSVCVCACMHACVISISDVSVMKCYLNNLISLMQVIIWTRRGWSRVCTAILGMIFLMYFRNTWPCNDRIRWTCTLWSQKKFLCVCKCVYIHSSSCECLCVTFFFSLF